MIYFLLVFALAALAFELTQPGFGFAGFAGLGMLALGVYGLTVVPVNWFGPGPARRRDRADGPGRAGEEAGPADGVGLVAFAAGSVVAWRGMAARHADLAVADRRGGGGERPVLRVRAHRGDPIAGPDRERPARADRPGGRGPRQARPGRAGLRQGRHVARPVDRRRDRIRDRGAGAWGGRPRPSGGGRASRRPDDVPHPADR